MRNISYWAKNHVTAARILIVMIKIVLVILAIITGKDLLAAGVMLPSSLALVIAFLFFAVVMLYPSKKDSRLSARIFYIRQKACDFLMPFLTFLMIVCAANQNSPLSIFNVNPIYASSTPFIEKNDLPTAAQIIESLKNGREKNTLTRQEKRILRKEFKTQLKIFVVATVRGDKEAAKRTWLTIAVIVVAIGLLYPLAALSCSISCSGADGAAIAVLVVGLTGLIWGSIALIKRINRGRKTETKTSP